MPALGERGFESCTRGFLRADLRADFAGIAATAAVVAVIAISGAGGGEEGEGGEEVAAAAEDEVEEEDPALIATGALSPLLLFPLLDKDNEEEEDCTDAADVDAAAAAAAALALSLLSASLCGVGRASSATIGCICRGDFCTTGE